MVQQGQQVAGAVVVVSYMVLAGALEVLAVMVVEREVWLLWSLRV